MQIRDIRAERRRLVDAGAMVLRPRREVWGVDERRIADPDGVRIVLVGIPCAQTLMRLWTAALTLPE